MGRPGRFKHPELTEGPLKDLNNALHQLHLRAGLPSLSTMCRAMTGAISRTRLHDAFSKPGLPPWDVIDALVEVLATRAHSTSPESEIPLFERMWRTAALAELSPGPAPAAPPRPAHSPQLTAGTEKSPAEIVSLLGRLRSSELGESMHEILRTAARTYSISELPHVVMELERRSEPMPAIEFLLEAFATSRPHRDIHDLFLFLRRSNRYPYANYLRCAVTRHQDPRVTGEGGT
ncbi:hypothetical protein ACFVIM_03965 [Streptomyces sp. NPDC057638]|uniref:hypothetical protein n=1 Tax=Streptomyces sp. NPDC057638 TaxID=3346190 RepID=UPI0036A79AB0